MYVSFRVAHSAVYFFLASELGSAQALVVITQLQSYSQGSIKIHTTIA